VLLNVKYSQNEIIYYKYTGARSFFSFWTDYQTNDQDKEVKHSNDEKVNGDDDQQSFKIYDQAVD